MSDPTREELRQAAEFCINNNFCDECVFYNVADCLRVKDRTLLAYMELEEKMRKALKGLKRGECFCECGLDNPMMAGAHSKECQAARAAIKAAEEGRG